jgi:hypothetical protein
MGSVSGTRISGGQVVPRAFVQQEARTYFVASLLEFLPEAKAEMNSLWPLPNEEAVRSWQAKYHLYDRWVYEFLMLENMDIDIHEGRWFYDHNRKGPRKYTVRAGKLAKRNGGYFIALYELHEYFEHEDGTPSDDDFDTIGMYDPRTETENEAVARIMPELERRLRNALRVTERDDRDQGETVSNRPLPPAHHFGWTVRYQVLGESYRKIAETDDIREVRTVSDAVRRVSDLVGLTLREPGKGGRPRKTTPTRSARCIAIRQTSKTPAIGNGHLQ